MNIVIAQVENLPYSTIVHPKGKKTLIRAKFMLRNGAVS